MEETMTTERGDRHLVLAVAALCLCCTVGSPAEEPSKPGTAYVQAKATTPPPWTNICQLGSPAWLDPDLEKLKPLKPQMPGMWPKVLQQSALAFAMDSAEAMLTASESPRGGEFARAVEVNRDFLMSLTKKDPEKDRISNEEHKALLTVRMALYVDAAVGLRAAHAASKNKSFRDTYALHQAQLEAVAMNDWRTYKDWGTLEMESAETDGVCVVLAAYLGKERPSR
jgi:hypothetical protein